MNTFTHTKPFILENQEEISELHIAYHTYGQLNETGSNVIWVCHALTANSDVLDWWTGLFGKEKLFDPDDYFIVCPNILGSCYGTTGPATPLKNQRPLLTNFPQITTRDMAAAHNLLREHLGIEQVKILIGASLGGQQALEWSIQKPSLFDELILIATNARHSAYGIAFNESQRLALRSDPTYGNGDVDGVKIGLQVARSIAMLSYRSYDGYEKSQTDFDERKDGFSASGYQRYQGLKLANRFNAYSYECLTVAMDSHNVGRGRTSVQDALQKISARTLCIGIRSDLLFPPKEQLEIASHVENSYYIDIDSDYGHDGFLIEYEKLHLIIEDFIKNDFRKHRPTTLKAFVSEEVIAN